MIKIRWLMVAVAIAAGMMGWRQHQIYQRLREEYQAKATHYGAMEEYAIPTKDQWLAECREVDRRNREGPFEVSGGIRAIFTWPDSPEVRRQKAEIWRRLKIKYEQAARRPWLPIEPEDDSFWDTAIINP